jgi:LPXTG-motif cell wall-anchored protein
MVVPDKVTFIGNGSFSYCVNMTSITLGKAVNSIGNYEFSHCYALTSITFTGKVAPVYVGSEWFYYTPENITGYAYSDSNFNTTAGAAFNELPMVAIAGSAGGSGSSGSSNDNTMSLIGIIAVVAIVLLVLLFLFMKKKKKKVQPNFPPAVQPIAAVPVANQVPPAIPEAPVRPQGPQLCPSCGYPAGTATFCMKCGNKLR